MNNYQHKSLQMRCIVLTFILVITNKLGFASNSNAIAYQIGEFIGMLVPIGVVVLIIWLIVKAIKNSKKPKE